MMRRPGLLITGLFLLLSLLPLAAGADQEVLPFAVGEKITYQLKWGVIPAGTVILEVLPHTKIDGQPARHFRMTMRSRGFIDAIYKVRSSFDGYTDLGLNHSLQYHKKQREGGSRRHIFVFFDPDNNTVQYHNQKKAARLPIEVPEGCFDPFSVIYYCRLFDFANHQVLNRPVADGKRWVMGRVDNLGRQTVEIDDRRYDTYLIEPEIKHLSGVFKKSKDANIHIWLSADGRRIPVKLQSKVIVGSFTAELVAYQAGRR